MPLFVDFPDKSYLALRSAGIPVFRWDELWPKTPQLDRDVGRLWATHIYQLPCHQDLSINDVDAIANTVLRLIDNSSKANGDATQAYADPLPE